jgi:hypothetical protein
MALRFDHEITWGGAQVAGVSQPGSTVHSHWGLALPSSTGVGLFRG